MEFYEQAGTVALGSRLRRLSEAVTADAARIFAWYDVGLDPRWFPVFYLLAQRGPMPVTQIARAVGHSHASVSQIIRDMKARRLVLAATGKDDGRVTVVRLSAAGRRLMEPLEAQCHDVGQAVDGLLAEARENLWKAMADTERLLAQRSLFDRVRDVRKHRECEAVRIVDYQARYQKDFARLNREWIEQYWRLEEADRQVLDDPKARVLKPGGFIVMALREGRAIGTCAMLKRPDDSYELAKMAVTPAENGKGIGELLARGALARARKRGARRVYLESNSRLQPAIHLYRKLGFREFSGGPSPYERCDIQMELWL
jgi:ribosomal protein S18 acetylase RimI-like enzyme